MPQKHTKEKNCIIISVDADQFVSTSKEQKGFSQPPETRNRSKKRFFPRMSEGTRPYWHLHFQLLASELKVDDPQVSETSGHEWLVQPRSWDEAQGWGSREELVRDIQASPRPGPQSKFTGEGPKGPSGNLKLQLQGESPLGVRGGRGQYSQKLQHGQVRQRPAQFSGQEWALTIKHDGGHLPSDRWGSQAAELQVWISSLPSCWLWWWGAGVWGVLWASGKAEENHHSWTGSADNITCIEINIAQEAQFQTESDLKMARRHWVYQTGFLLLFVAVVAMEVWEKAHKTYKNEATFLFSSWCLTVVHTCYTNTFWHLVEINIFLEKTSPKCI